MAFRQKQPKRFTERLHVFRQLLVGAAEAFTPRGEADNRIPRAKLGFDAFQITPESRVSVSGIVRISSHQDISFLKLMESPFQLGTNFIIALQNFQKLIDQLRVELRAFVADQLCAGLFHRQTAAVGAK